MANGFYNQSTHGPLSYVSEVTYNEATNSYTYGASVPCDPTKDYIIEPTNSNTFIGENLTGKNLIIKPGVYNGWVAIALIVGTASSPSLIRVANGGQAIIKGNFKVATDSKYVDILGINDTFKGHSVDGIRKTGTYALWVKPGWHTTLTYSEYSVSIGEYTVTNIHMRFVEACDADYSTLSMKNNNRSSESGGAMLDMILDDCFFHTARTGEGAYIGSTKSKTLTTDGFDQHEVQMTSMRRNLFMFCGREGYQFGHLVRGSNIENNVVVCSAIEWDTAFEPFQDKAVQFAYRTGGINVRNNIVIGAGEMFNFSDEKDVDGTIIKHVAGEKIVFDNNVWWGTRNFSFYRRAGANRGIGVVYSNSWAANTSRTYSEAYPNDKLHYTSFLGGDQLAQIELTNFKIATDADGTDTGAMVLSNVEFKSPNVPTPAFVNDGGIGVNWEKYSNWKATYSSWSKYGNTTTPILYKTGDRVFRWDNVAKKVKIFESKTNQTVSVDPLNDNGSVYTDVTDSVYGNTDFRMQSGTLYANAGIGFGEATSMATETTIERKLATEPDSAYVLETTIVGTVVDHYIVNLLKDTEYTIRITTIENGIASKPPTIISLYTMANALPVAKAGADKTIALPVNSVVLSGSGTDSDGTISAYLWTQEVGPNTATISDTSIAEPTASGLIEGIYTFKLTVTDDVGGTGSDTVVVSVTAADSTAPTAPTVTEGSKTATSFTVNWSGATDNTGVTGYKISIDGVVTDVGNVLTYSKTNASASTAYSVQVLAYDAAGNESPYSTAITVTTNASTGNVYVNRIEEVTYTSASSLYNGKKVGVAIGLPQAFRDNPVADYPTLIFFPGRGEDSKSNTGPTFNTLYNAAGFIRYFNNGNETPYIILAPQLPLGNVDWPADFITEAIQKAKERVPEINANKIVISGWSNGGAGLNYVETNTSKVKGLVIFATGINGVDQADANRIVAETDPGLWFFHENDDPVMGQGNSGFSFDFFRNAGATENRRTLYDGNNHDCVTKTLNGTGGPLFDPWSQPYPTDITIHDWIVQQYNSGVDTISPTVFSAKVEDVTPDKLNIVFSESVTGVAIADFAVSNNTITAVSGTGSTYTFTLGTALAQAGTPTLSYTGTAVVDSNNNPLTTFSGFAVTNNVKDNVAPVANAGADLTISEGSPFTLNGTASDSDGTIASTQWSIFEGTGAAITSPNNLSTGVTGMTAAGGPYTFRLTVIDNEGAVHTDDVVITVQTEVLATSKYVEAENYNSTSTSHPQGSNWALVNDANASNGTAMHDASDDTAGERVLTYNLNLESGTYRMFVRSRYGNSSSADTLFVYINGVKYDCRTSATGTYSWWELNTGFNISNKQTFALTGNDVIEIRDRESIYIDRIYITKNGDTPVDGATATAPSNTALPVISGTTTEGSTLTTTDGTWSGTTPITYAYQWERGGAVISGATAKSYTLVTADVGATITCVVTATNSVGSAFAESAATGVIQAASGLQNASYSSLENITNTSGSLTKVTPGINNTWDAYAWITQQFNSTLQWHDNIAAQAGTNGYSVLFYTTGEPTNYTNAPLAVFSNGVGFYCWKNNSLIGSYEGSDKYCQAIVRSGSLIIQRSAAGTTWTDVANLGAITTPQKIKISAARLNGGAGEHYKIA